jgi:predicted metalloprotease
MGISARMEQMRAKVSPAQYNALSVRLELQADCFAGVWANHAQNARQILENGDIESAMNAAAKHRRRCVAASKARVYVVPESFTHGTSAQRTRWFNNGPAERQCQGVRHLQHEESVIT